MAQFYGEDPLPGTAGLRLATGLASLVGKVKEGVKDRLYKNIYPYGYTERFPEEVGPMQRVWNAVVKDKQESKRTAMEQSPTGYEKEKLDLWGMYLGKGQKYGTVKESQYKPSIGSGKGTYYSIPKLEEDIKVNEIKAKDINDFKNQVINLAGMGDVIGGNITGDPDKKKGKFVSNIQPLGDATISAGEDEKGYYISYYDKWDLNPFKGGSATESSLAKFFGMDKKEDIAGGDAPEIYGRIYFDKKTGKRIK